jgi:hypothetical protein
MNGPLIALVVGYILSTACILYAVVAQQKQISRFKKKYKKHMQQFHPDYKKLQPL